MDDSRLQEAAGGNHVPAGRVSSFLVCSVHSWLTSTGQLTLLLSQETGDVLLDIAVSPKRLPSHYCEHRSGCISGLAALCSQPQVTPEIGKNNTIQTFGTEFPDI